MKRTSILATTAVTALLGIAALGASSASADVLCMDVDISYDCPAEKTYGVGTEFHAWDKGGVKLSASFNGANMATCNDSEFDWTVTGAGGAYMEAFPKVDTTNLSFANCGNDSVSVVDDGTGVITVYQGYGGSQKGTFTPTDLQIKVKTDWVYNNGTNYDECVYKIVGSGTIAGWKTDESSVTKVVFTDAPVEKVSGSVGCFKAKFSGQYNFPFELNPFNGGLYGIYVLHK